MSAAHDANASVDVSMSPMSLWCVSACITSVPCPVRFKAGWSASTQASHYTQGSAIMGDPGVYVYLVHVYSLPTKEWRAGQVRITLSGHT